MESKVGKWMLVFLLIFVIIVLTVILILGIKGDFGFFNRGQRHLLKSEKYAINNIENIKVEAREAQVKFIVKDDVQDIEISIYGKNEEYAVIQLENNYLSVKYKSTAFCFGFCFDNSLIEIIIPSNYQNDISVDTVSGDVYLDETMAKKLQVKTVSGEIEIGNYKDVVLTTTSGDVKVSSAEHLEVRTISGDVDVNNILGYVNISTTSGSVNIERLEVLKNSVIKSVSGDVEIERCNTVYVDAKTTSGDIDIYENSRLSDIVLNITTVSGDIEVN